MRFNERLKEARLKRGLKQRELAEKIKTTNTSVSNWEKGLSQPSASVVTLLAKALEISPFDLLGEYTLTNIQSLESKNHAELSYEDSLALTFATDVLNATGVNLSDVIVSMGENEDKNIKELESALQNISWDLLLQDGGKELIVAYDYLNKKGKVLLLEYMTGLLQLPIYLEEPEMGIDVEQLDELINIKEELKGGA